MHMTNSLRMSLVHSTPLVVLRLERIKPPKVELPNTPSEAGIELADVRRELGCTVVEFAELLNITKGTLSSYIYGLVQTVPESVLKDARLLRRQAGRQFRLLCKKPMRDIVDTWCQSLGFDVEKKSVYSLLANVVGVDRATVWRWRERDMRPEVHKLKEYNDLVVAAAKRKSRRKAKPSPVSES